MGSRIFFTSRQGGFSAPPYAQFNLALHVGDDPLIVRRNRARLAEQLSIAPERVHFMNQSHGSEIVEVSERARTGSEHALTGIRQRDQQIHDCDALITRTPGNALAVLVADCAPVLLVGEQSSAAIHVGWRGLFGGIVERVLERMQGERFTATIGPTICGRCYEVGDDLRTEAIERNFVVGARTLDIPASILAILKEHASATLISAEWNGQCTFEQSEYFSYRREHITGRQAGVVVHES